MAKGGYIKLHRLMLESWVNDLKPAYFKVTVNLLLMANWKPGRRIFGGRHVEIGRGQVASSLDSIAEKCPGVTKNQVRAALKLLQKCEFLRIEPTRGFTHLTILNYSKYQAWEEDDPHSNHTTSTQLPHDSHTASTPIEEGKEGVEGKNGKPHLSAVDTPDPPPPEKKKPSDSALRAAEYLKDKILSQDPGQPLATSWTEPKKTAWAKKLDLLHGKDKQAWPDIRAAIDWLFGTDNTFVVLSARSLRDKFGNIRVAMKADKTPQYVNGQRKLPPPTAPAPEPERPPGETPEQWRERRRKEREERERQANEQG